MSNARRRRRRQVKRRGQQQRRPWPSAHIPERRNDQQDGSLSDATRQDENMQDEAQAGVAKDEQAEAQAGVAKDEQAEAQAGVAKDEQAPENDPPEDVVALIKWLISEATRSRESLHLFLKLGRHIRRSARLMLLFFTINIALFGLGVGAAVWFAGLTLGKAVLIGAAASALGALVVGSRIKSWSGRAAKWLLEVIRRRIENAQKHQNDHKDEDQSKVG
jgi:hypothetical protein